LDDVAEDGILAIKIGTRRERDVNLTIPFRRISHMRNADGALLVQSLFRDLGHADWCSAGRCGSATPAIALRQIAGLWITELHEEARQSSMHTLAIVETPLD